MEYLNELLPIIIYILLIVLIILLIVICIKVIKSLKKVDAIVDNVDKKVRAFDGLFEVFESTTSKLASLGDKIVSLIIGGFEKIFKLDKKNKEEIESEEN